MKKSRISFNNAESNLITDDILMTNDTLDIRTSNTFNVIEPRFTGSVVSEPINPDVFDFIFQSSVIEKNKEIGASMNANVKETEQLQEIMKEEKRKYNNKMAARRCRQRKEDKIRHLEQKLSQLQKEHDHEKGILNELIRSIANLEQELWYHTEQGCQINANF